MSVKTRGPEIRLAYVRRSGTHVVEALSIEELEPRLRACAAQRTEAVAWEGTRQNEIGWVWKNENRWAWAMYDWRRALR
jgi:hypothetical protein